MFKSLGLKPNCFDIHSVKYLKFISGETSALILHDFYQHWTYSSQVSLVNHSPLFSFLGFWGCYAKLPSKESSAQNSLQTVWVSKYGFCSDILVFKKHLIQTVWIEKMTSVQTFGIKRKTCVQAIRFWTKSFVPELFLFFQATVLFKKVAFKHFSSSISVESKTCLNSLGFKERLCLRQTGFEATLAFKRFGFQRKTFAQKLWFRRNTSIQIFRIERTSFVLTFWKWDSPNIWVLNQQFSDKATLLKHFGLQSKSLLKHFSLHVKAGEKAVIITSPPIYNVKLWWRLLFVKFTFCTPIWCALAVVKPSLCSVLPLRQSRQQQLFF